MSYISGIGVQQSLAQQNLSLKMVKQNADAQKDLIAMIEEMVQSTASLGRGSRIDFSA